MGELKQNGFTTVKVGIVSDVHGDIVALDAALARIRKLGCDPIVVCR